MPLVFDEKIKCINFVFLKPKEPENNSSTFSTFISGEVHLLVDPIAGSAASKNCQNWCLSKFFPFKLKRFTKIELGIPHNRMILYFRF